MTKPLFSIIFVNYQSAEKLRQALCSLKMPLKDIPHEIRIINNDVHEQTAIDELGLEYGILVEHLTANYGFARANNIGAKKATGDILLFLNPDTLWVRGSFHSLAACIKSQGKALIGLRLLSEEGKDEAWSCGAFPSLPGLFWRKIKTHLVRMPWENALFTQVDWVSGAGLALSKKVFDTLGGFDETFFLYYEDVDLSFRAEQAGVPTFRFPFLVFRHGRGQSHTSKKEMKQAYFKGQLLYFEKHRSLIEYKILTFLQRGLKSIRP